MFKSGQAEEVIKCQRHERGDESPSQQGGLGGLPQVFFLNFGASMCVINGVFMRLGPDFSRFGHDLLLEKIFLVMQETECWTKLFETVTFFLLFFYSTFLWHYFIYVPAGFGKYFYYWSLVVLQRVVFRKDIHLVFSITCRKPVKDAGFASVGIRWDLWLHRNGARAYCRTTTAKHFST